MVLALLGATASAQSAMEVPIHELMLPAHRDYFNAGYVRAPIWLEVAALQGGEFGTTTGGVGAGLAVGVSKKFQVDASISLRVGGGSAVGPLGERRATQLGWSGGGTVGWKFTGANLGHEWRTFAVVFSGVSHGSAFVEANRLSPEVEDAGVFFTRTRATSTPIGAYWTIGNLDVQISPLAALGVVWRADLHTALGEPPRVPSDGAFGPLLTASLGLDVGYAPTSQTLGVVYTHAPAMGGLLGRDTVNVRVAWVLRANKTSRAR